eukprot:scaffold2229_cov113-Isochrysis_galbana.AAC.2
MVSLRRGAEGRTSTCAKGSLKIVERSLLIAVHCNGTCNCNRHSHSTPRQHFAAGNRGKDGKSARGVGREEAENSVSTLCQSLLCAASFSRLGGWATGTCTQVLVALQRATWTM